MYTGVAGQNIRMCNRKGKRMFVSRHIHAYSLTASQYTMKNTLDRPVTMVADVPFIPGDPETGPLVTSAVVELP